MSNSWRVFIDLLESASNSRWIFSTGFVAWTNEKAETVMAAQKKKMVLRSPQINSQPSLRVSDYDFFFFLSQAVQLCHQRLCDVFTCFYLCCHKPWGCEVAAVQLRTPDNCHPEEATMENEVSKGVAEGPAYVPGTALIAMCVNPKT